MGFLFEVRVLRMVILPVGAWTGGRRMTIQWYLAPALRRGPARSDTLSCRRKSSAAAQMMWSTSATVIRRIAPILMKAVWMKRINRYGGNRTNCGRRLKPHTTAGSVGTRAATVGQAKPGRPITAQWSVPDCGPAAATAAFWRRTWRHRRGMSSMTCERPGQKRGSACSRTRSGSVSKRAVNCWRKRCP